MTSDLSVSWCNECDLSARGPHLATLSVSAVGLPAPVSVRGCPAAASDWAGRLRYRSYLDSYRANGRSLRPRYNRFAVLHDRLSACLSAASLSLCLSVSVCLSPCPAPPRHTHTHTHTHGHGLAHGALVRLPAPGRTGGPRSGPDRWTMARSPWRLSRWLSAVFGARWRCFRQARRSAVSSFGLSSGRLSSSTCIYPQLPRFRRLLISAGRGGSLRLKGFCFVLCSVGIFYTDTLHFSYSGVAVSNVLRFLFPFLCNLLAKLHRYSFSHFRATFVGSH